MTIFSLFRKAVLMAEGEATAGGGTTAPAAAPAPAAPAAPAAQSSEPANVLDEINSTKTVGELEAEQGKQGQEEETPEAKEAREAEEAKKAQEVPETYAEFKVPEGMEADQEMLGEFSVIAKELGLTQDQAQKLVDLQSKSALAEHTAREEGQAKALEEQSARWADEVKNDPELGGAKFEATKATAIKAMQAFGSPELRQFLNESGIGNHPQMVKLFHAIGTSISEDRMVVPGSDTTITEKSAADTMFGDVKFT